MNATFIILGYGIPKNILKDDNYARYLPLVFNTIFETHRKEKSGRTHVILCGGPTDMYRPYRRTEAAEMKRLFLKHLKQLRSQDRRQLSLHIERRSLSTLENLVFAKELMVKKRIPTKTVTVFCEFTRAQRIKKLGKRIFGPRTDWQVVPIDFDTSANRYLDREFLTAKESKVLKFDLWALRNRRNFDRWHNLFVEKLSFLRTVSPKHQVEAIEQWWRIQFKTLKVPR
ncbi:MAG: YdcF family protein [Candidatus Kerfeldbacteria bacterium]|nr:YdcF family protein [Candidatus Kerfeldbacteria bacterium]